MKRASVTDRSVIVVETSEEQAQALRFGKARMVESAGLLEFIGDLMAAHGEAPASDVAKRLGVSHPTAVKSVARPKRQGLVTPMPRRGIFLTEAAKDLARRLRARHRLMVELLLAVGVPAEVAEADAEGMEHHASGTTLNAFARFLANRR